MSRFSDEGDGPDYNNAGELWEWNLIRSLGSTRGQKALAELRDALLALPDRRLISGALCTVGGDRRPAPHVTDDGRTYDWNSSEFDELLEQGAGVCAVGAYLWHCQIKSGLDPARAFAALPTLADYDGDSDWRTIQAGEAAGLARTLASHLAYQNDVKWSHLDARERWQKTLDWVEAQLAGAKAA